MDDSNPRETRFPPVPSAPSATIPGVRTRAISPGDLVLVNKRGRVFYARVLGTGAAGGLSVEPLDRRVSWRQASAREVVDHWTHARPDRAERPPAGQLALDGLSAP